MTEYIHYTTMSCRHNNNYDFLSPQQRRVKTAVKRLYCSCITTRVNIYDYT